MEGVELDAVHQQGQHQAVSLVDDGDRGEQAYSCSCSQAFPATELRLDLLTNAKPALCNGPAHLCQFAPGSEHDSKREQGKVEASR